VTAVAQGGPRTTHPLVRHGATAAAFVTIASSALLVEAATPLGTAHAATAFTVSPAKVTLTGTPGSVNMTVLRVTNDGDAPLTLVAIPSDFSVDSAGASVFSSPSAAADSCARWTVASPNSVTVPATDSRELRVVLSVPPTAPAGAYHSAILIGPRVAGTEGGAGYTGKIGIKLAMTVADAKAGVSTGIGTRSGSAPSGPWWGVTSWSGWDAQASLTLVAIIGAAAVWALVARARR
jgi:hypothetical protein